MNKRCRCCGRDDCVMCRQPDPAPVESAANHGKYYWKAQAQAKDGEIASLKAELAEANGTLQEHESEKWCFNDQHVMKSDLATAQIAAIELAKKLAEVKCASGEELARVTADRDALWGILLSTGEQCAKAMTRALELEDRAKAAEADAQRLREALTIYADPVNWKCGRCGGKDHINCFMSSYHGPIGDDIGDQQGYSVAQAAVAPPSPAPTSRSVCFQCGEDITGTDHRGKCSALAPANKLNRRGTDMNRSGTVMW